MATNTTNGTISTPAYGRRLVPNVLDDAAKTDPGRVYAAIPRTSSLEDGFFDITMADLARCVDFMARWIENKFGKSNSFETLTYVGLSEPRGPVTLLAAIKTGYKLFVPSPRNTAPTNASLMNKTGSTKVLYIQELSPLAKSLQAVQSDPSVLFEAIPSLNEMLDSSPEHYPYHKAFDEARDDPIVVLHSSGSTGEPKPIICTHGSLAAADNDHNVAPPPGRQKRDSTFFDGKGRMYLILPFFHLGGFWFMAYSAIFNNLTLVLGPPQVAPDAALLQEIARKQKLQGIMVVPAILQQMLHQPDGMDFLAGLDFASVAGAPAPAAVGDKVKSVVELFNWVGSTETFPLPELYKSRDDWLYHEFSPYMKHEMKLYDSAKGTYELVIIADESTKDSCPAYHNLPGVGEYYTKDLFLKHPEKPNLYKYYGRRDDIIVLGNGEKVNPIPLEQYVEGHPSIKGAVLVGNGRSQTALLLEPTESLSQAEREKFIEAIWGRVQESNKHVAGPGRVALGKVICALPDKPFPRTAKNTVIRTRAEQSYQEEIDAIYSAAAQTSPSQLPSVVLETTTKTFYEPAKIVSFLRQVFASAFAAASEIGEDEDFFAYGLDSIQTLEITANLKRNLQQQTSSSVAWITPRTVIRNASFTDLSILLAEFLNNDVVPEEDTQLDRVRALDEAVARHTAGLPATTPEAVGLTMASPTTVAFVGSTGYLGLHTLASLIRSPDISQVYCLNRSKNAQERQEAALAKLDKSLLPLLHKLAYLQVELGRPLLGLEQGQYDLLASKVDVVVYNSWRLDFSIALRSFEPFLRTTRELIDLSIVSGRRMRVVFISSLSSVGHLSPIPEAAVEDSLAAMNTGYAQSKLAAERILISANRQAGVPASIVRIGQIGGPTSTATSAWADQPWISGIVHSSEALGCLPSPVLPVDWIPVDTAAAMLHGFITQSPQSEAAVYNVCSDKPQDWDSFVSAVRELRGISEVVSLPDWVQRLRDVKNPTPEDAAKLPALKMLDWYEALGDGQVTNPVATDRARAAAKVEVPPLDRELLVSWLRSWGL